MSLNQVENGIRWHAIEEGIWPQMARRPETYGEFFHADGRGPYLGEGVWYVTLPDGRLTVMLPGTETIDPVIEPVPYLDLMRPGECMAHASRRVDIEGYPVRDWGRCAAPALPKEVAAALSDG